MTSVYRLIEDCAAASGSDGFAACIVDLAGWTGVRQLMVFEMTGDAVTCLLSRNYERVRTGEVLAGRYMDGWFRMDPLLPELMRLLDRPDACAAHGRHRCEDAARLFRYLFQ
ncbi:hypothetical protein OEG86_02550 [Hoeflea alexandrii]|uniref:hypothetical protein n=1 Tax=Hoeflea alexandrii TaxID=288436 RepID=UPI0022702113|nr:hypothetical protein [Hoeflea alexandrii]MCY0151319.1 hypothetical protein [Hoeflea alexandrii]